MKFLSENLDGTFTVNRAKVAAVLSKATPEVVLAATKTEDLDIIHHGTSGRIFWFNDNYNERYSQTKAEALERDLQILSSTARFSGIKLKLHTIKQAFIWAIS